MKALTKTVLSLTFALAAMPFDFQSAGFQVAQAAGRNCGVSVGGVGMPHGAMGMPQEGIDALTALGYTEESSYHADLFLWVEVNCILGPLGSICTPTAVLKDIITQRELARATGVATAAFGVYSVNPQTAIAKLPRCRQLPK